MNIEIRQKLELSLIGLIWWSKHASEIKLFSCNGFISIISDVKHCERLSLFGIIKRIQEQKAKGIVLP